MVQNGSVTAALPDVFSRYRPQITAGLKAALERSLREPNPHLPDKNQGSSPADGRGGATHSPRPFDYPFADSGLRLGQGGGSVEPLYDMLRYQMGWIDEEGRPAEANAGKAVRPALCLFSCEAVGGRATEALPAAIALELIHNFSLVHDDIQDGDTHRRHRPTIWYRWGHSHGVNAGDAMSVLAHLAMFDGALAPAKALGVSRLLTTACAEMIEGQVLDLSYEQRQTVSVADYLLMISKKTGALLEASVHMGSTIGTDDARTVDAMRTFGKELGLLFQVRDDMLGVWGKQEATGKPVASDIHRRKKALPAVHALATAKGPARERLLAVYRKDAPLTEQDVTDVLAVMDEVGTATYCQSLAKEHAALSLQALDGVELSKAARRECAELTHFLLEREY